MTWSCTYAETRCYQPSMLMYSSYNTADGSHGTYDITQPASTFGNKVWHYKCREKTWAANRGMHVTELSEQLWECPNHGRQTMLNMESVYTMTEHALQVMLL